MVGANGLELMDGWIAQKIQRREERQQYSADKEFIQTAAIRHRIG